MRYATAKSGSVHCVIEGRKTVCGVPLVDAGVERPRTATLVEGEIPAGKDCIRCAKLLARELQPLKWAC